MGVPPVIHFGLGFSMKESIQRTGATAMTMESTICGCPRWEHAPVLAKSHGFVDDETSFVGLKMGFFSLE